MSKLTRIVSGVVIAWAFALASFPVTPAGCCPVYSQVSRFTQAGHPQHKTQHDRPAEQTLTIGAILDEAGDFQNLPQDTARQNRHKGDAVQALLWAATSRVAFAPKVPHHLFESVLIL